MLKIKLYSVIVFTAILVSCKSSNVLTRLTEANGDELIITSGLFSGCNYVKAISKKRKITNLNLTIEFGCEPSRSIYIRKSTFDIKGNYLGVWHAITDTVNELKMFNTTLIPELQTAKTRKSFRAISVNESQMLIKINNELIKKGYKFKMPNEVDKKVIGWVNPN